MNEHGDGMRVPVRQRVLLLAVGFAAVVMLGTTACAGGPGRLFRDGEVCPKMVVAPAGTFAMGSPDSEAGRDDHEGPRQYVTIAEPFAVGVHEVTFEEWDACARSGRCGGRIPDDEGWGRGDPPVINVSWDDAGAYTRWLSERTGREYWLPSEAEWELRGTGGHGDGAALGGSQPVAVQAREWGAMGGLRRRRIRGYGAGWVVRA